MHKNIKIMQIIGLLTCGFLFIVSCGTKSNTPTVDPNAIYTQVGQTVIAQQTKTAQAAVTQVDVKAIYTEAAQTVIAQFTLNAPQQTNTKISVRPTLTLPSQPGSGSDTTETPAESAIVPTATRIATKAKVDDLASFVYQWPTDGHQMAPGQVFDTVWRFKNIGPTTWNDMYTIRWYMGNKFGVQDTKYTFGAHADKTVVKPGEVVEITVPGMQAPTALGHYFSHWRLCNDKVQCFYLVFVEIVVENP